MNDERIPMITEDIIKDFERPDKVDAYEYQTLISEVPLQDIDLNMLGKWGWELVSALPVGMAPKASPLEIKATQQGPSFIILYYFKRKTPLAQ